MVMQHVKKYKKIILTLSFIVKCSKQAISLLIIINK